MSQDSHRLSRNELSDNITNDDGQSAAIAKEFKEVMLENEILAKENRLYYAYLHRYWPSIPEDDPGHDIPHAIGNSGDKISDLEKYCMALQEREARAKQLSDFNNRIGEDIHLLKAIIESMRTRTSEMRKEAYEFQRDVLVKGEDGRTGTLSAEHLLEYWRKKIDEKAQLTNQLLQKVTNLQDQRAKLEAQVKYKESQGDHLLSIDFHQLQIKNQQYNQKVRELNNQLFTVKSATVKTVQLLNKKKKELNSIMEKCDKLTKEIEERKAGMTRMTNEQKQVLADCKKEKSRNRMYKLQQANPDIPHVVDYVMQKAKLYDLQGELKNWQRKVEIVALAAATNKATLNRLRKSQRETASMVRNIIMNNAAHAQSQVLLPLPSLVKGKR